MEAIIAIVVVVVILAIVLIALYNNLVQLRNRVDNAWSQIDVQLQRRLESYSQFGGNGEGLCCPRKRYAPKGNRSAFCGMQRYDARAEDGCR